MLPNGVLEDLSTDQYLGYKICWFVICGEVDDLQLHDIGLTLDSRWLTLAHRILHLYTATANPSKILITLAQFCLKVYFPTWLEIKHYSKLTRGSKNRNLSQRIVRFLNQSCRDCFESC